MISDAPTDLKNRCACGCGAVVPAGTKYVRGHYSRTPEGRVASAKAGTKGQAVLRSRRMSTTLARSLDAPSEVIVRSPSEQAMRPQVSEAGWSDDDVVTMLRTVDVDDDKIGKMIDLMDFIGKIKRGEE